MAVHVTGCRLTVCQSNRHRVEHVRLVSDPKMQQLGQANNGCRAADLHDVDRIAPDNRLTGLGHVATETTHNPQTQERIGDLLRKFTRDRTILDARMESTPGVSALTYAAIRIDQAGQAANPK